MNDELLACGARKGTADANWLVGHMCICLNDLGF